MSEAVPVSQLRAFVERVERIEEEIRAMNADKSEVYKEAKGFGFDVKIIKKVVAARRLDADVRDEQDALFSMYWDALYGEPHVRARAHVENIEQFPHSSADHLPAADEESRDAALPSVSAFPHGQD